MRNINPDLWGKYYWKMLEYTCLAYPDEPQEEDKKNVKVFLEGLSNILPCEKCRSHYKVNLLKYPLSDEVMSKKNNLLLWLFTVHNSVNQSLGKREITQKEFFGQMDGNLRMGRNKIMTIVILIILIVILIVMVKMWGT